MDLRKQAQNVANQGRFGDSMLLHVNPVEMKGLASAMPLTVNPQTGQPEAFLPFLAPILGSVLGKAFLPTLLPNLLGGKALLASAIGSGLAQTAATGDVKKGLLAGLTGFGVGKFLEGIGGAASQISGEKLAESALQQAGTPLGTEAAQKAITEAGTTNLASSLKMGAGVNPSVGQTLSQTISPDIAPATNLNVMRNVQELAPSFDAKSLDFSQLASDLPGLEIGAKATMQTLSDPMVYLPAGLGMGTTATMISQEEFEKYLANAPEREKERLRRLREMYPEMVPVDITNMRMGQEGGATQNFPMFSPTQSPSYQQFYGSAALGVPQVIDPRLPTQGFVAQPFDPSMIDMPTPVMAPQTPTSSAPVDMPEMEDDIPELPPGLITRGTGPRGGLGSKMPDYFGNDLTKPYVPKRFANPIPAGFMPGFSPEFSYFSNVNPTAGEIDTGTGTDTGTDTGTGTETGGGTGTDDIGNLATIPSIDNYLNMQALGMGFQDLQDRLSGADMQSTVPPMIGMPMFSPFDTGRMMGRSDGGSLKPVPEDNKGLKKLPEDVRNKMGFMAPGGDTKFPDLTGDGKVTQADILKGRGVDLKQEGGITEAMLADPLTNQVAQFILGNETNDEIVSAFIDKYGSNAFRQLRRAVLKTLAPNAQTEGMIKGSLAGGMEDDIFGVIGDPNKNGQRVAVSQDEFIVPADVVSMLGDGSSDAGANKLERMMDRIRTEKTNTTKQARPINDNKVLPA
mgnify:CR=1 FL=1